ncbi:MAG: ferredoxin [Desulfobacteraceae bacterium]|nr:ferredoxin [Desulfobacteraceae bacterium]
MKRPEIDLSGCVLCDICTDLCPYIFRKNHAGYIEVLETDDYPEEDINEIIKSCRGDCIEWDEDA